MRLAPPGHECSLEQAHASECGITCLAMVLRFHGFPDMRRRLAVLASRELGQDLHRGADLLALSSLAEHLGFETNGYQGELDLLFEIGLPCIAHRRDQRFVVVWAVSSDGVGVTDPATGKRSDIPAAQFTSDWSGIALEILPTDRIDAEIEAHSVPLIESSLDRLVRAHAACLVARGGFASIYHGHRQGVEVAIKAIPSYVQDTDSAARAFRRELTVLQRCVPLDHPHIIKLIEVDESNRALMLEWADRGSLAEQGAPLPPGLAVHFARQIAEALGALHARGITHRDVTPGNILIFSGDIAKLSDFGISRTSSDSPEDDVAPVYISHVFASPEQLRGAPETARSDVFSLGLTIFFALTGKHLFAPELDSIGLARCDQAFSRALEAKLRPLIGDEAEPVVRARLEASRVEAADRLAALIGRCLRYDPVARCDAAQLMRALEGWEARLSPHSSPRIAGAATRIAAA
jgi:tRNA A-37 threonylcarbamoyl transferase component Bud32